MLTDHVAFCLERLPNWNPVSVVGQHMQQADATPAETVGFTFSTGLQYAEHCLARGIDIDVLLRRFTFFFDISISFFEEISKFRAARRVWARLSRERLGAKNPSSWRFKFHGQTSGVDLTRQQPLNNVARVATQAIAGILSGLQSMHTDAYDEAVATPSEESARIAVATQNILREEAHLCDVIDPLAGSYYVETLGDRMEAEILTVIAKIDAAGGMYKAAESGLVQTMIGESALRYREKIERGEQKVVGVNCYQSDEEESPRRPTERPDPERMMAHVARFKAFKESLGRAAVESALASLACATHDDRENVFARVVEAAEAGVTHGEIVGCLRKELGFGRPLVVV